ncbi:zinc-ribbon domain-containing protein [Gordonibacter massiliensis]|uniref:Zinc-ribbon domain-containing protein n=2 Tax=Gordonibacter massiliensis (ex Traore et al. 2017) TaxID=1841863 RepID=A0A842JM16_9ACTN|nr:zinc-ribbon domain-containing protein [Gordonibacter massiliensis (ex Traore et al. 2017)]
MCFRPPAADNGPMKCPACGAEVAPNATACPQCGNTSQAPSMRAPGAPPVPPAPGTPSAPTPPPAPRS